MPIPQPAEVSLNFNKPSDARQKITVSMHVEIYGVGSVDFDMTEHDFVHLMSGTVISAAVDWEYS